MADGSEITGIILSEIGRQWDQARQSENQRAALSNFIIVISVAAQGFVVDKDFPRRAMAVAISLALLGVFGFVATAKYYERFRLSMTRVGRLREQLDGLHAELKLDETEKRADKKHSARFLRIGRIRLHLLWEFLMLGIALLGVIDIFMICKFGH